MFLIGSSCPKQQTTCTLYTARAWNYCGCRCPPWESQQRSMVRRDVIVCTNGGSCLKHILFRSSPYDILRAHGMCCECGHPPKRAFQETSIVVTRVLIVTVDQPQAYSRSVLPGPFPSASPPTERALFFSFAANVATCIGT